MRYKEAIQSIEPVLIWLTDNGHIHLNDTENDYTQRIANIHQQDLPGYTNTLRDVVIGQRTFNEIYYRVHALPHTQHTWMLEGFIRVYEVADEKRWRYFDGWLYADRPGDDGYQTSNGLWVQLYHKGVLTKYGPTGWIGPPATGCWVRPA